MHSYVCCVCRFRTSQCNVVHRDLPSFPTRRSSDLGGFLQQGTFARRYVEAGQPWVKIPRDTPGDKTIDPRLASFNVAPDRKSTRLNSSHTVKSYAVFCLKKKRRTEYSTYCSLC